MKKYYFISALVGYIAGCVAATIAMGVDVELALVALVAGPLHIPAAFEEYNGGTLAILTTSVAITQLIVVGIIGRRKQLPWLLCASLLITFAVLAFWGGTVIVDSVLR